MEYLLSFDISKILIHWILQLPECEEVKRKKLELNIQVANAEEVKTSLIRMFTRVGVWPFSPIIFSLVNYIVIFFSCQISHFKALNAAQCACMFSWVIYMDRLYICSSHCGMFVILPLINNSILHLRPQLMSLLPWLRWETQLRPGWGYICPPHDCQLWSVLCLICILLIYHSIICCVYVCFLLFMYIICSGENVAHHQNHDFFSSVKCYLTVKTYHSGRTFEYQSVFTICFSFKCFWFKQLLMSSLDFHNV